MNYKFAILDYSSKNVYDNNLKFILINSEVPVWHVTKAGVKCTTDISLRPKAEDWEFAPKQ